jgi:6-pyruvoyltetrahydropterin/6-carboxytetrahydropterin synthase
VKGEISEKTGFVANLKELSRIINEKVILPLDHRNINLEVAFMKGKLASTENLAISIWQELEGEISGLGATLYCIKVEETENNMAEYFGE